MLTIFLDVYYRERIHALFNSGQLWKAYERARRLRKLVSTVDLPMCSQTVAGNYANEFLGLSQLQSSLLNRQSLWSDGERTRSVLNLAEHVLQYGADAPLRPRERNFADGIVKLAEKCPVDAYQIFVGLHGDAHTNGEREVTAYLALRAAYTASASNKADVFESAEIPEFLPQEEQSSSDCTSGQPIRITSADWDRLAAEITLPGMRSDVTEMRETISFQ